MHGAYYNKKVTMIIFLKSCLTNLLSKECETHSFFVTWPSTHYILLYIATYIIGCLLVNKEDYISGLYIFNI